MKMKEIDIVTNNADAEENETFEWDDTIRENNPEPTLLDEGDYEFIVDEMVRGQFAGSYKIPECNMATILLQVKTEKGPVIVKDRLYLVKSQEWKLSRFFESVGLKKKGEAIPMPWGSVVGSRGRAHIVAITYTNKVGQFRRINSVAQYLEYDAALMAPGDDEFMVIPDELIDEMPFK